MSRVGVKPFVSNDELCKNLARVNSKLSRGQVWCHSCGRTQRVDSAGCLRSGWPKCCGYTMSIDSPEERATLASTPPVPAPPHSSEMVGEG